MLVEVFNAAHKVDAWINEYMYTDSFPVTFVCVIGGILGCLSIIFQGPPSLTWILFISPAGGAALAMIFIEIRDL